MNHSISAFFPAYNEEGNIETTIVNAVSALESIADRYEVIIINDGSYDNTKKIVEGMMSRNINIKIINHDKNRGYGAAIQSGIYASIYDYIFFSDSDCQFDLREIENLIGYIPKFDAVIGYRKDRKDSTIRLINAKLWNIANWFLFDLDFKDIDCAFKVFKKQSIKSIMITSRGAMVSSEILFKLKKMNYSIKEVGVNHFPRVKGKPTGANFKVILTAFKEMFVFYIRDVIYKI